MINNREEWLEARLSGIGGSEAPVIYLGEVFDHTLSDLYMEKRRVIVPPDISMAPDVQRGNALEPIAAELYAREYGIEIEAPQTDEERWNDYFVWSKEHPFMFANLDFRAGSDVIGEIKSPRTRGFMKAKREGLRNYYLIQGMHNLAVTGAERCIFVIFSAELWQMHVEVIERDEELIAKIIEANRAFWDCVEEGRPPDMVPGAEEATKKRSEKMPETTGGEVVSIKSTEFADAVARFFEASDIIEEANDLKKDARGDIVRAIGSAEVVEGAGARVYHRDQAGRKTLDKKALAAAHPEIDLSQFEKTGKPSKYFRVFKVDANDE